MAQQWGRRRDSNRPYPKASTAPRFQAERYVVPDLTDYHVPDNVTHLIWRTEHTEGDLSLRAGDVVRVSRSPAAKVTMLRYGEPVVGDERPWHDEQVRLSEGYWQVAGWTENGGIIMSHLMNLDHDGDLKDAWPSTKHGVIAFPQDLRDPSGLVDYVNREDI